MINDAKNYQTKTTNSFRDEMFRIKVASIISYIIVLFGSVTNHNLFSDNF